MWIQRDIEHHLKIFEDKILILSGPRQCGKTSLIQNKLKPDWVLNMDVASDRRSFKKFPESVSYWLDVIYQGTNKKPLIFIDEIQKVRGWRDIIKGVYDKYKDRIRIAASGSSAFDLIKRDKGDSLAGRAVWLQMQPIMFREFLNTQLSEIDLPHFDFKNDLSAALKKILPIKEKIKESWDNYISFGSFPEPLVKRDHTFYNQWLRDYTTALTGRDLKELNTAKDVDRVAQVFELLLEGIGSTYSLNSIARTLQVHVETVKSDISALARVLWAEILPVIGVSKSRQIQREKKFYPVDFCLTKVGELQSAGAFHEAVVYTVLKRFIVSSFALVPYDLGYYRDYNKREIDFLIKDRKTLLAAIECKRKPKQDNHLNFFAKKYRPKHCFLVVEEPGLYERREHYDVISVELMAAILR